MNFTPYEEFISNNFRHAWQNLLSDGNALFDIGSLHEWNLCWWETYKNRGVAKKELFVLTEKTAAKIESIWPLFIRHRYGMKILHWIGQVDGMITDYMVPVLSEKNKNRNVLNFIKYLSDNSSTWDIADFKIPQWSNLLSHFIKNLVLHGNALDLQWQLHVSDNAVAMDLPETFENYVSQLGKRTRTDMRQYLKAAIKNDVRLKIYRSADIVDRIQLLFELNSENWTVFQSNISKKFMIETVKQVAMSRNDLILPVLSCKEQPLAAVLGFENNNTCYLHPAGVIRKQIAGISPGITMYAMLIQSLIQRSFKKLDLSPGLEEYKLRLGGHVEPVYQLLLWHNKSKITRWKMFDWARKKKGILSFKN